MGLLRVFAATLVVVLVGLYGFAAVLQDRVPSELLWARLLLVAVVYALGGIAIALLLPHRWYLAAAMAWGPAAFGMLGLAVKVVHGGERNVAGFVAVCVLGFPGMALAAGWLGKRVAERAKRRPASRPPPRVSL